jgi:hypothetical protein
MQMAIPFAMPVVSFSYPASPCFIFSSGPCSKGRINLNHVIHVATECLDCAYTDPLLAR